jgi:CHAT domain-containing protein
VQASYAAVARKAFRDANGGPDDRIPALPASREEADAIASVAPWRTVFKAVDFDASRATIMETDLGQFGVVHFATHGRINYAHPEASGLLLSLVDQQGRPQQGFFGLRDIYSLRLPVGLVVLSACNTALGKEVKGEGLIGITRGFMHAGARGVAASLWKVEDDATAELMKRFYEGMFAKGLTPGAALREAQISMWQQKRWRAPYYWASFIIQGQYDQRIPAPAGHSPVVFVFIAALAGSLCAAAGYIYLRRRNSRL